MDPKHPVHHWRDLEERDRPGPPEAGEFAEAPLGPVIQLGRRDFLATTGVAAAAVLASCTRPPVERAVPRADQPEGAVPGRSYLYASTCGGCSAACGVVVTVRDGRPIKLEGNDLHPASRGGLCAVGQASPLGLYDATRPRGPRVRGKDASWAVTDRAVLAALEPLRERGAVRFLSGTVASPTLRASVGRFLSRFRDARHVVYDPLSCSAILDAHEATHGVRVLPRYHLDRAEVVVSFDADFLGTWLAPVEHTAAFRMAREREASPPRSPLLVQLESRMSLTGAKADRRIRLGPGEVGLALTHLAARLARLAGAPFAPGALEGPPLKEGELELLARRLWEARGRALVLCGSQDLATQTLANLANHLVGAYGTTVDLERPSLQRQGDDRALEALLAELERGEVSALVVHGVNPAYDLPGGGRLAAALRRVPLLVSLGERWDETARLAHYVCPDHHFLESWGDAEATSGVVSLSQPAIRPLHDTRSALETLAIWSGEPASALDVLRATWEREVFPRQRREASFQAFWDRSLHDGVARVDPLPVEPSAFRAGAVRPVRAAGRPAPGRLALVLHPAVAVLDGRHAGNPWLQELPDPVTKVTWDNCASVAPATARRLGIADGDVVRLEAAGAGLPALELSARVQPGQHEGTVSVALGYGGVLTGRFARSGKRWLWGSDSAGPDGRVGKSAAPLLDLADGTLRYTRLDVALKPTGARRALACTQTHHTLALPLDVPVVGGTAREPVRETTARALASAAHATAAAHAPGPDLWPDDHRYPDRRWHMVIDLDACTGCSACVVACQAENNVPVVGRDEVLRHREMHWIRIDRYYAGDGDDVDVVHQPLLCGQCDNAACETVCPVLATVHSSDGLNQQVYNRCVGTRYCANNCPYKVRRFNWFDNTSGDRLQDLALNPDVTVRSRGVMEKCTYCVQRIHTGRIQAGAEGRTLADGAIQTACQQSCPARAITFGDLNDPSSRVSRLARSPRAYRLLEELNMRPALHYLAVVRNRDEDERRSRDG